MDSEFNSIMSDSVFPFTSFRYVAVGIMSALALALACAEEYPTFEELATIRAKAHEERFKIYVLDKLEVHSYVQEKRGLCFDFIGKSDGIYRSKFKSGPIMVDLANCGEEDDWIDGRIKPLKLLEAREHRDGLTKDQVDHAIEEINAMYDGRIYDPEYKIK